MKTLSILFLLLAVSGVNAYAQKPDAKQQTDMSAAQKYFTDTELITQDGKHVRFYSDVLKDKVVVINCFFATCKGVCLPMSRNVAKLQRLLDPQSARDVTFISITVDPTLDTPERLKQFATTLGAQPGWMFLTGTQENVDFIHKKLGQFVTDKNAHNTILIIGNERTGLWKKAFGMAKPDELLAILQSVINDGATKTQ